MTATDDEGKSDDGDEKLSKRLRESVQFCGINNSTKTNMSDGDEEFDLDRRTLLQTGALTVSTAAIAGCTDIPGSGGSDGGDDGGDSDDGTDSGTETGAEGTTEDGDGGPGMQQIALENFPYAPGEIDDISHYDVKYVDGTAVSSAEGNLTGSVYDTLEGRLSTLRNLVGASFSDTPTLMNFRTTEVLRGGVTESDATSALDDESDYEQEDSKTAGYTIYVHEDDTRAVGVRGETVVSSTTTTSEDDALDVLETVLETARGDSGTRYVDDDSDMQTLLSNLSGNDAYEGGTHSETSNDSPETGTFSGETARGIGVTYDGGTAKVDWELVFASSDDVSSSDISSWTDSDAFEDYSGTSSSVSDNAATVEASISTGSFAFTYPSGGGKLLDYMPAPDEVYDFTDHMYITRIDPGAVDDSEMYSYTTANWEESGAGPLAQIEDLDLTQFSTTISATQYDYGTGPVAAATGDFSQSDVVGELEDSDFDEEDTYSGFTIYEGESEGSYYDTNISVGVSSSIVVAASDDDSTSTTESDATDLLEVVIDAGTGDADRYAEESDDFNKLISTMQGKDLQDCHTQDSPGYYATFDDTVGRGTSYNNISEDDSDFVEYLLWEESDDVDTDNVEDYIDNLEGSYTDYDDLTSEQDGRMVKVTGTISTTSISSS